MIVQKLVISFMLLALPLGYVSGFLLLDNSCIAPSPCYCTRTGLWVDCGIKNLTRIPTFRQLHRHYTSLAIYLQNNELTEVPQYAFKNLETINATHMSLYLSNNQIHQVDVHAFDGIEHKLNSLYLNNNSITHLPSALQSLTALTLLDLLDTALTNLDATVMSKIGVSLQTFLVSADHFVTFPYQINSLNSLRKLKIDRIQFPAVSSTVFYGLIPSLIELDLSYSKLKTIPVAVCYLDSLQTLKFSFSSNLFNSSLFGNCHHKLNNLTTLKLLNNELTGFPPIPAACPHLKRLFLLNNNISQIDNSSLPENWTLTYIDLSHNDFKRIPSALNKLVNFQSLYIDSNQITSVNDVDLVNLGQLRIVSLNRNPIAYIAPDTFKHNLLLQEIGLEFTQLHTVPPSVRGLTHLGELLLWESPTNCSCTEMANLRSWNVTGIQIGGFCDGSRKSVKMYLYYSLPSCP